MDLNKACNDLIKLGAKDVLIVHYPTKRIVSKVGPSQISNKDMRGILSGVANPIQFLNKGVIVDGNQYAIQKADYESTWGYDGGKSVIIVKTINHVIISFAGTNVQFTNHIFRTEAMGKTLRDNGL